MELPKTTKGLYSLKGRLEKIIEQHSLKIDELDEKIIRINKKIHKLEFHKLEEKEKAKRK